MPLIAFTREVSPAFANCQLTHQPRVPIDVDLARAQHAAYERALAGAGCSVFRVGGGADLPDSVFIEDTAVVLDEVAVMARPGAESRRAEVAGVEEAIKSHRLLAHINAPGTLDGGDVLVAGRTMFVGCSTRTNADAIDQLRTIMEYFGYAVAQVDVKDCLHLKSGVTALADDVLLINRERVPASAFRGFDLVDIEPGEHGAANVVRVGSQLVCAAGYPRTRERLERRGYAVTAVDVAEIAKAEGAMTCCSLIFAEAAS